MTFPARAAVLLRYRAIKVSENFFIYFLIRHKKPSVRLETFISDPRPPLTASARSSYINTN